MRAGLRLTTMASTARLRKRGISTFIFIPNFDNVNPYSSSIGGRTPSKQNV